MLEVVRVNAKESAYESAFREIAAAGIDRKIRFDSEIRM